MPLAVEPGDALDDGLQQGRIDAGPRLVEQDQPGLGHQHAGQLEQLALAAREDAGRGLGMRSRSRKASQLIARSRSRRSSAATLRRASQLTRMRSPLWPWPASMTFSSTLMAGKGRGIWKVRPRPRPKMRSGVRPSIRRPSSRMRPALGPERAGDEIEQGGLAGAVRADQASDRDARSRRRTPRRRPRPRRSCGRGRRAATEAARPWRGSRAGGSRLGSGVGRAACASPLIPRNSAALQRESAMAQAIRISEPRSGLDVRAELEVERAPESTAFLISWLAAPQEVPALHAMWTGPEISCPFPGSRYPSAGAGRRRRSRTGRCSPRPATSSWLMCPPALGRVACRDF